MSEYHEQVAIFEWAELQQGKWPELALLNGSLNGVKLTIGQAVKAKKAGMKRGYPDMFLPVARREWHGLFIELKVGKNKASPEQKTWIEALQGQGYCAVICYGANEAIEVIRSYLEHAIA